MKCMKAEKYVAPHIEVLEIAIEKGFSVSSVNVDPWSNGGHLGSYEAE